MNQVVQQVVAVPLNEIYLDEEWNCRGQIAMSNIFGLAKQIKDQGLIQPVTIAPYDKDGFKYKMVSGHRRFKAVKYNGDSTINAIIRDDLTDLQASLMNLTENIGREDLNIAQEARAIERFKVFGYAKDDLASLLKVSENWVETRFMLTSLPHDIQQEAAAGIINGTQIKQLYKMKDNTKRYDYVKRIKEAKERAEKVPLPVEKLRKPGERRMRKPHEIQAMIDEISAAVGYNFATVCLGWANGFNSNLELYIELKKFCHEKGVRYDVPEEMYLNS